MQMTGAIRMPAFEVPLDYRWLTATRLAIAKGKELGSCEKPVPTGEVRSRPCSSARPATWACTT
jgi:hypothetical protein